MSYEDGEMLMTHMLNELARLKDDKSKNITYWANVMSLLTKIDKIKNKKERKSRDVILNDLVESKIIKKNLREDIDHLAKIRVAYGHDDSSLVMSGVTQKTMEEELNDSYYFRTRSSEENFPTYTTDRKVGLLCHAVFTNLIKVYKKLVKPELFDPKKYDININMFEY